VFKLFFLIKMYSVSVKCFIFTLVINIYLFFGQNTGGKELMIAKDLKTTFPIGINGIIELIR
jgi:hypothetical protein